MSWKLSLCRLTAVHFFHVILFRVNYESMQFSQLYSAKKKLLHDRSLLAVRQLFYISMSQHAIEWFFCLHVDVFRKVQLLIRIFFNHQFYILCNINVDQPHPLILFECKFSST